jgi:beta-glucosidase-like glycosyl hydrolase
MPAKKKPTKKITGPTVEQQLQDAKLDNEQLRDQVAGMRRALREQQDRTDQARLERDGVLLLIALATNHGAIAQVKDGGRPWPNVPAVRGLAQTPDK